jgi:hypothetical protein
MSNGYRRVIDYKNGYPYLLLGYKTPCEFEKMNLEKLSNFLIV